MASKIDGTNGLIQNYIYLETPAIASGFSYTVASGVQNVILNPSVTFASGTVILPASPVDGMTVTISTTQQITTFTVSASTGQSVSGGFSGTPFQAKTAVSYVYNSTKLTWYPFTAISPYILPAPSTSGNLLVSDGTIWGSTSASSVASSISGLVGIGTGQTWQAVTRVEGTTYTNSTGKPIMLNATFQVTNTSGLATAVIDGYSFTCSGYNTTQGGVTCGNVTLIIPSGSTYSLTASGASTISNWSELR